MKYYIQETITREYLIHADSMQDAIAQAHEIDDTWDYDETGHGFTYIIEDETGKDMVL